MRVAESLTSSHEHTERIPAVPGAAGEALSRLDHRVRRESLAPEDAPPGFYLAAEGETETRLIPLAADVTRIGRGRDAEVRLDDTAVSRRHALIARRGQHCRVLDDRSANGTFVNGRRVTEAELHDGDVLLIGGTPLRYLEVTS